MMHRLKASDGMNLEKGKNGDDGVLLCCLWKARFPQRLHRVCDFVCRLL